MAMQNLSGVGVLENVLSGTSPQVLNNGLL